MRMQKVFVLFASICLIFALLVVPSMGVFAAEGVPPKPSTIILGTHEIGTGGYSLMALIVESLVKKYPEVKWRSIPSGVDLGRTMMPRTGETATPIHNGGSVWIAQEGLYDYANLE